MRRVYIDENLSPELVSPLAAVYRRGVVFRSWRDEQQGGVDDLTLIPYLGGCGFDLIVTKDRRQIDEEPSERTALVLAGLSWLGVPDFNLNGPRVIAEQLSVVLPAVGEILRAWPSAPTAYRLGHSPFAFREVIPL